MIARIVLGIGLFALGYFVGKEIGRAESIRDQLRGAVDGNDTMQAESDAAGRLSSAQRPTAH